LKIKFNWLTLIGMGLALTLVSLTLDELGAESSLVRFIIYFAVGFFYPYSLFAIEPSNGQ